MWLKNINSQGIYQDEGDLKYPVHLLYKNLLAKKHPQPVFLPIFRACLKHHQHQIKQT
jgi:hypothetical protein